MISHLRPGWRQQSGLYHWHGIGTVYSLDGEVTWCWSFDDGEISGEGSGYRTPWRAMVKCEERYRERSKNPFAERRAP